MQLFWEGHKEFETYQQHADGFICSNLPDSPYHQVFLTPGGLVHLRDGANAQYVTGTAFIFSVYSDLLARHNKQVTCGNKQFTSSQVMAFAKKQVTLKYTFFQPNTTLLIILTMHVMKATWFLCYKYYYICNYNIYITVKSFENFSVRLK